MLNLAMHSWEKGLRMDNHLPPEAHEDCFRPPSIPTEVCCLHCGQCYESYLIQWRESTLPDGRGRGFWCCPVSGCDGAGFGFDIHPTDPEYVDPDGRDMGGWVYDDEEEDDGEWMEELDAADDDDALMQPPANAQQASDADQLPPEDQPASSRISGFLDDEDDIPF